jgi:DNA-binding transcriptional ArsR family regulator
MSTSLPRSAIVVLRRLKSDGPMTPRELLERVDLAPRTLTFALRMLFDERIVSKKPNLMDMRQPIYHVNMKRVRELHIQFGTDRVSQLNPSMRHTGPSGSFNR